MRRPFGPCLTERLGGGSHQEDTFPAGPSTPLRGATFSVRGPSPLPCEGGTVVACGRPLTPLLFGAPHGLRRLPSRPPGRVSGEARRRPPAAHHVAVSRGRHGDRRVLAA